MVFNNFAPTITVELTKPLFSYPTLEPRYFYMPFRLLYIMSNTNNMPDNMDTTPTMEAVLSEGVAKLAGPSKGVGDVRDGGLGGGRSACRLQHCFQDGWRDKIFTRPC